MEPSKKYEWEYLLWEYLESLTVSPLKALTHYKGTNRNILVVKPGQYHLNQVINVKETKKTSCAFWYDPMSRTQFCFEDILCPKCVTWIQSGICIRSTQLEGHQKITACFKNNKGFLIDSPRSRDTEENTVICNIRPWIGSWVWELKK